MEPVTSRIEPRRRSADRRGFGGMIAALALALLLARFVAGVARTGGLPSPALQILLADLTVWVPLTVAVLGVARIVGWGRLWSRLGVVAGSGSSLAVVVDVFAGIAIALVCRALDAFLSLSFFGTTGLERQLTLGGGPGALYLVVAVVGTCVVSPVIEELFFRGAFQRGLAAALPRRGRFLAVVVTAGLFAFAHVFTGNATSSLAGLEVFVTTFVLGVLVGTLVAVTGRIRGAVLAHVLFNAVAVALTWPA
jgi:uncharacterized protein